MTQPAHARPGEVTWGGVLVGGSGMALLLSSLGQIRGLDTSQLRSSIRQQLSRRLWSGMHVGVGEVLSMMRVMLEIGALCGAAVAVLAFFVLRGDRGARIAVTVLAVPLVIGGLVAGQVLALLVLVGAVLLWRRAARDWFAHVGSARSRPATARESASRSSVQAGDSTGNPSPEQPTRPGPLWPRPGATYQPRSVASGTFAQDARPQQVTTAGLLTFVGCGLVGALMLLAGISVSVLPRAEIRRDVLGNPQWDRTIQLSTSQVVVAMYAVVVLSIAWCVLSVVLAALAMRRRRVARSLLIVSAGLCVCVTLLCGLSFPPMWLITALAGVTIVLLASADASRWYADAPRL